jgi:hypothetical protein
VTGNGSEDSSVSLTTEIFDTIVWNDIRIEKKVSDERLFHVEPIAKQQQSSHTQISS